MCANPVYGGMGSALERFEKAYRGGEMQQKEASGGVGMLAVRVAGGTLLAAHGAQKLFGWWNGPGMEGWTGAIDKMGMKPAKFWAPVAAGAEFGGGLMTGLGLLNPLGPLAAMSAMIVATRKVHWGKPVFVTDGGAELPLTNIGIALAVAAEGPGKYSVDNVLGIRLPLWMRILATVATIGGLVMVLKPEIVDRVSSAVEPDAGSQHGTPPVS